MTAVGPVKSARETARYPALTAWRRELAAGERTIYTFDALWRAACAERNAQEAITARAGAQFRREAHRIITQAAREGGR